ncbi:MAG: TetR/AcrR family transcriptional regulator [Microthrixaceae bacterium]
MAQDTAETPRAAARRELIVQIKQVARTQLEAEGAAQVSLRAVTRELGMVSSSIYRYFASRDELLTALIIDAYSSIAQAADAAWRQTIEDDVAHGQRWLRVGRAVRDWARLHPQEWALVYGSPVVGYEAPPDTVEPAGRIAIVLGGIARDAALDGTLADTAMHSPPQAEPDVVALVGGNATLADRALTTWITLVGAIYFEVFGHLHGVVADRDRYFDEAMAIAAEAIGLTVELE